MLSAVLLRFHYEEWAVDVMYYIVTDRAQDGPPDGSQTSAAHHGQLGMHLLGHLADVMARPFPVCVYLAWDLESQDIHVVISLALCFCINIKGAV